MRLTSWGADLLDLLLPAGCVACGSWIPGGKAAPLVCGRCRSRLRESPWPRCPRCHHPRGSGRPDAPTCSECREWPEALATARHAFVLEHPADDLVHALKYEGWRELAEPMGEAVARLVTSPARAARVTPSSPPLPLTRARAHASLQRAVVVPVPTTRERMKSRGYNQAELLAVQVARRCRLPLRRALSRVGSRRSQTSLAPTERRENVRGVFRVEPTWGGSVRGSEVLLVDDVLTTGATASEAAAALAETGAGRVTLLTFARALADAPAKAR